MSELKVRFIIKKDQETFFSGTRDYKAYFSKNIEDAEQYDSYERAENKLGELDYELELVMPKGLYQIEKMFVIEGE